MYTHIPSLSTIDAACDRYVSECDFDARMYAAVLVRLQREYPAMSRDILAERIALSHLTLAPDVDWRHQDVAS